MSEFQNSPKRKSYDVYRNIQKNIIMLFFYITVIAIYVGLTYILWNLLNVSFGLLIGLTIFYFILCAILGIVMNIILDIVTQINYKFDVIKNDIASKIIKTPFDFAKRTGEFLCSFLSFSFFDISYAMIKIPNTKYYFSNPEIEDVISKDLETILQKSKSTEELLYFGKYTIENRKVFLYVIPIWFGENWLGYFGLYSNRRLWKYFRTFLADFEDNFIDDQLMHVIDYHIITIQKEMYREIDAFSNKIITYSYKSIREYQKDILLYLIDKLRCKGGIFITSYKEQLTSEFTNLSESEIKTLEDIYKNKKPTKSFDIYSDPENKHFNCVFKIPVKSEKYRGEIYLFDDDNTRFNFFENILVEIEDFKIGSDLSHLVNQLEK